MEATLKHLNIASLENLCQLNCQLLVQKFTEQQLNLLADKLRIHLWQQKILPASLKNGQHISVNQLDLPDTCHSSLLTHKIYSVADFIQRDAVLHFTANWNPLDRLAARVRILCLFTPEYNKLQIASSSQIIDAPTLIDNTEIDRQLIINEFPNESPFQPWLSENYEFPDEFLFQPWLSENYCDDFFPPAPSLEQYLIDDICRLPMATSRRHEIWAGAPMVAGKKLKEIAARLKEPQKIFEHIYNQLLIQWQLLENFCQNNHLPLPNYIFWSSEILLVRREFYKTSRSRFLAFVRNLEKFTDNEDNQLAILDLAYTAFEFLWLLPDDALLFLQDGGKEEIGSLPSLDIFTEWLILTPRLEKNLHFLQKQGTIAQNRLVNGYLRSVVKFARNWVEKENAPELFMDMVQEGAIGLLLAVQRYDYRRTGRFIIYATSWIWQNSGRAFGELTRTIRLPVHQLEKIGQLEQAYEKCLDAGIDCSLEELCLRIGWLEPDETQQIRDWLTSNKSLSAKLGEKWQKSLKHIRRLLSYVQPLLPLYAEIPTEIITNNYKGIDEQSENLVAQLADLIHDDAPGLVERTEQIDLRRVINEYLQNFPVRTQQIICLRFGLNDGRERTLEEVGQTFELTRERIRQLEKKVFERLKLNKKNMLLFTDNWEIFTTPTEKNWPVPLFKYFDTHYNYWSKFDIDASEFQPYWEWLDRQLENLPGFDWHQTERTTDPGIREIQLTKALKQLGTPAHYAEIAEQLNNILEINLDDNNVYAILNRCENAFISLGEGVFSLVEWEQARSQYVEPVLPFCPAILPDLLGQTDTLFESILVANQHLKQTPKASQFLDFMLKWSKGETTVSNALRQAILNSYYLTGLIPFTFHFCGNNPPMTSTLPDLPLLQWQTHCLRTLTQRLTAMPVFWWLLRQYQPARPADLVDSFTDLHPSGLNDVANRLKLLAGLGAVRRLSYGRYELTDLGRTMADLLAQQPALEPIISPTEPETGDDFNFDWGIW